MDENQRLTTGALSLTAFSFLSAEEDFSQTGPRKLVSGRSALDHKTFCLKRGWESKHLTKENRRAIIVVV